MKKSAIVTAMLSLWMVFAACEQQESLKAVSQLETLKTTFKKAEPAEFSFKTDAPADQVKWSVSPNRNVQISITGYTAKIHFSEAGRYFVTATDQTITSRTAVTVDTTTYVPGDTSTVRPPDEPVVNPPVTTDTTTVTPPVDTVGTREIRHSLVDEEFVLTPIIVDSSTTIGLVIRIEGTKSYPCQNTFLSYSGFYKDWGSSTYKMTLHEVIQPGAKFCDGSEGKVFARTQIYPIPLGKTNIEISLNGKIYSGFITREGSTFKISWPYTEGIKFSQVLITK
ncbi:hypothetical protein [Dyadobacter sp. CY312]|uniref:hypothetical protein n=1 Tax=Dyadobacter sp. CY312 TaxID=2907303 RepID=UPI001F2801A2|nr:hypothetical protein [Dyadobacter sp. CY312]MCE7040682.1 hypothetical protein [Dyadobacter sp. CY312]